MKPAWDKLMTNINKEGGAILVADVDCTAAGKSLCETNGVKGYPTIKHGDPANLEDYQGGRDYDALEKFAKGLKPLCSPMNLALCEADDKAKIEGYMAMSAPDLDSAISKGDGEIKAAEDTFDSELKKLQETYQELQKTKEDAIAAVKDSGLGMMKAVKAAKVSKKDGEL